MTQRQEVSKCSWKKAPTDLLNAGLPQTFSLSKANTVSVKCNKARTALNSSSLCGNSEGQGRSRAVSRRGPLWAGLPGPLAGCVLAHWSLGPPALALRCWPPNTEATYWTPPRKHRSQRGKPSRVCSLERWPDEATSRKSC